MQFTTCLCIKMTRCVTNNVRANEKLRTRTCDLDFTCAIWILKVNLVWKNYSQLSLSRSPMGLSEVLRGIRTSTYQIGRIEEKLNRTTTFQNWICKLTSEMEIYWKYWGKEKRLLFRSNFFSFPQKFGAWCYMSMLKQGPGFHFEITGYSR